MCLGTTDTIHLLEVTSEGQYVATGNGSGEVHVFDTISGEVSMLITILIIFEIK